jgi:hypothetical protein
MERQGEVFPGRKSIVTRHYPVNEYKLEIAFKIMLFKGIITALKLYFSGLFEIFKNLPEIKVYLGFNLKAEVKIICVTW